MTALNTDEMKSLVISFQDEQVFEEFVKTNDINIKGDHGQTLLGVALACIYKRDIGLGQGMRVIKRLLDNGIDVNAKNVEGKSVLHMFRCAYILQNMCFYSRMFDIFRTIMHNDVERNFKFYFAYTITDNIAANFMVQCDYDPREYKIFLLHYVLTWDTNNGPFFELRIAAVEYVFVLDVFINAF